MDILYKYNIWTYYNNKVIYSSVTNNDIQILLSVTAEEKTVQF